MKRVAYQPDLYYLKPRRFRFEYLLLFIATMILIGHPGNLVMSQNAVTLDVITLVVIISATSFGTVLGFTFVYWMMQLEFPSKIQAAIVTLMLLAGGIAHLLTKTRWGNKSETSKTMKSSTSSEAVIEHKTRKTNSGLHLLESKFLNDPDIDDPFTRAVSERKKALGIDSFNSDNVKIEEFYKTVYGKCCESVIGSVWIPIGIVGPVPLVGSNIVRFVHVPLATVEGALVASVNRGCKALRRAYEQNPSNLACIVSQDHRRGITRGPSFRAPSIEKAAEFLGSLHDPINFKEWKRVFNSSSPGGHVRLIEIRGRQIGNYVYVRVRSDTSEAMGMNMISRGCQTLFEHILNKEEFKEMQMESLSGNYCVDKKPAAINWVEGRGQEVIVSARIPRAVIAEVFGITDIDGLVRLNLSKNIIGSAAAGSIGGFNAHVANVVAAIYLSTGQDVAQVVDASQAMTLLEHDRVTEDLVATLTMPCIEIGVRGGGTGLPHQKKCLNLILGDCDSVDKVEELARCVCLTALAGELSLLASLQSGTLVSSHFKLNH